MLSSVLACGPFQGKRTRRYVCRTRRVALQAPALSRRTRPPLARPVFPKPHISPDAPRLDLQLGRVCRLTLFAAKLKAAGSALGQARRGPDLAAGVLKCQLNDGRHCPFVRKGLVSCADDRRQTTAYRTRSADSTICRRHCRSSSKVSAEKRSSAPRQGADSRACEGAGWSSRASCAATSAGPIGRLARHCGGAPASADLARYGTSDANVVS